MELTNLQKKKNGVANSSIQSIDLGYGKIPPQARDLEAAVLGAITIDREAFDIVSELLKPECFYVDAHVRIFKSMQSLNNKSQPIDLHTVIEELRQTEELEIVGGPYYVTTLQNGVVNSANLKSHSQIIFQKFLQRELIRIGAEILNAGYHDSTDPFELLEQAEQSISDIGVKHIHGGMVRIDSVLVKTVQQIETWRSQDRIITGIPSGFSELDKATRGWQNGDLIIIAARPSVGKTAFALNIIDNAASNSIDPVTVAVWSLEMKAMHLCLRMLSKRSKILLYKLQTGRLNDDEMRALYSKGIQMLAQLKIFFDDKSGITMMHLKAKARRMKKKEKLGLIVVDYLQLMQGKKSTGNREQEVAAISRELKELAQELDIPIIALSQLSREVEKRTGAHKRPQLGDLRESGAIEQDADVVYFLWGPTDEEIAEDESLRYRRYGRIAKARNGFLLMNEFDFKDEIQLFEAVDKTNFTGLPKDGSWKAIPSPYFD